MPDSTDTLVRAINDFTKVQRFMLLAQEENAQKTYAALKEDYISLKVLLTSFGFDPTVIDKIKE